MINSINFIDGLDGLSTGVSLIAALTLGVIWRIVGTTFQVQPDVALLCAVLAGALAGFLPWNFHPAQVFIGTTGVYVVGFLLAALSILSNAKIAAALLILGVPIIDTFWIIIRRVSRGQVTLHAGPGPFPSPPPRPGSDPPRRRAPHLCPVHASWPLLSLLLSSTRGVPLYAFLGIVVGDGPGVVPADPARAGGARRPKLSDDKPDETAGPRAGPDQAPGVEPRAVPSATRHEPTSPGRPDDLSG